MIAPSNCAAIVLAAGRSTRFGDTDKLLAPLDGQPLAAHVARMVRGIGFAQSIAVVSTAEVAEVFAAHGFELDMIERSQPQGYSLLRGAKAVSRLSHAMVLLADMPFVAEEHLCRLLLAASTDSGSASSADNYLGPPAVLPVRQLLKVNPARDRGARALLTSAIKVPRGQAQLRDLDYIEDFGPVRS